jgi:[glutamine synthetase] adenylyltransferase / [glutamine synthetase]-adenylyl-L-tyrosine phosphorylase
MGAMNKHDMELEYILRRRAEDGNIPDMPGFLPRMQQLVELPSVAQLWREQSTDRNLLQDIIFAVASQSFALTQVLVNNQDMLPYLLGEIAHGHGKTLSAYRQYIREEMENTPPGQESEKLRQLRKQETIRIALTDILGISNIEVCARQLSNLAEALLDAACLHMWEHFEHKYGNPIREDNGAIAQFAVIAMGKLGGRELNFSSDVDLLFVYDGEGNTQPTSTSVRSMQSDVFFQKMASEMIILLSQPTAAGMVYRVDVRLRPDGRVGALVRSLDALVSYYESFAAPWERQALLRARPVAGDLELGERFIKSVLPLAIRKYVDMVEVNDTLHLVQSMRRQMHEQAESAKILTLNVKQRPGGIRDVEFMVQLVQMLYGGQYPEIRVGNIFEALRRVHQSGLLTEKDFRVLSQAYTLLRRIEHRLQMAEERQVYSLPAGEEELRIFAWRLGFKTPAEMIEELDASCQQVEIMLKEIFGRSFVQDDVNLYLSSDKGSGQAQSSLLALGFAEPESALTRIRDMSRDPEHPHLAARIYRLAGRLVPRLLDYLRERPDPDSGLQYFSRIALTSTNRAALFDSLLQKPGSLRLLLTIACESPFLSTLVERYPGATELLLDSRWLHQEVAADGLMQQFENLTATTDNAENAIAQLYTEYLILIGVRYLLGLGPAQLTLERLAILTQSVLQTLFHVTLQKRHPGLDPQSCGVALVGLGKLGGSELNFGSDLDIMFIYRQDSPLLQDDSPGGEKVQRFCQELMREFSAIGRLGPRLEVDARLRPFGSQSPLAVSLESADRYYSKQASTWERLALTRARFLTGDGSVAQSFQTIIHDFTAGAGITPKEFQEVRDMRQRIEAEKSEETLKAGHGGILDVEFLVQASQLIFGSSQPELLSTCTHTALRALRSYRLISEREYGELVASFYFLRDVENSLRIVGNVSVDALPSDESKRVALAQRVRRILHARMGGKVDGRLSSDRFFERLYQHQERVRKNYLKIFDRWDSILRERQEHPNAPLQSP